LSPLHFASELVLRTPFQLSYEPDVAILPEFY